MTVDWGLAEKFNCNFTIVTMKSMKLEIKHKGVVQKYLAKVNKFSPTVFSNLSIMNGVYLRRLPWRVKLDLTLEMLKFKGLMFK